MIDQYIMKPIQQPTKPTTMPVPQEPTWPKNPPRPAPENIHAR